MARPDVGLMNSIRGESAKVNPQAWGYGWD